MTVTTAREVKPGQTILLSPDEVGTVWRTCRTPNGGVLLTYLVPITGNIVQSFHEPFHTLALAPLTPATTHWRL